MSKTKTIQGNWIMEKDEIIEGDLKVKGNISGKDGNRYNLIVNGDLNCRNLKCGDLNCWDLDFFAVAFAYSSFKCKSVKGRRENSKYFCLDKEVEVTG